jgi:hypothetical protein
MSNTVPAYHKPVRARSQRRHPPDHTTKQCNQHAFAKQGTRSACAANPDRRKTPALHKHALTILNHRLQAHTLHPTASHAAPAKCSPAHVLHEQVDSIVNTGKATSTILKSKAGTALARLTRTTKANYPNQSSHASQAALLCNRSGTQVPAAQCVLFCSTRHSSQ